MTTRGVAQVLGVNTDGQFTDRFDLPMLNSGAVGMTSSGPDGTLWFTEPFTNQLGRITPDGTITEYPVPTDNSLPISITTDTNGNVWFVEYSANQIGEVVPNQPPVASAGGPYTMTYGGSPTLNGSGSTDPDGDPLTYSWTVNGHAGAATDINPTLTWSQLQALGVTAAQPFTVSVQVSDGRFTVASQDITVTLNMDGTTTVLSSSAPHNTALYGQSVTFTAAVSANAPGAPTGAVDFFDTTTHTHMGTVNLFGGSASLITAALAAGENDITATYLCEGNFLGSSTASPLLEQASAGIILLDPTGQGALIDTGNGS